MDGRRFQKLAIEDQLRDVDSLSEPEKAETSNGKHKLSSES